jgi:hypothetical protein
MVRLNYILVEVDRAPNHQSPDDKVNYQRYEEFHRVVSLGFWAVATLKPRGPRLRYRLGGIHTQGALNQ